VLDAVRAFGPLRVAEVAARTGISRVTVDVLADQLISFGLLREVDEGSVAKPRTGRRARRLQFRADAGYVLAIDLGAHKLRVAVADLRGDIIAEDQCGFEPDDDGAIARLKVLERIARSTLTTAAVGVDSVMTVCVGFPGAVDPESGVVFFSGVPQFTGINVHAEIQRRFGRPVIVENDANLAVIGERWRGVAADAHDAICVLAGERFGAGILVNGQLVRGGGGAAGEMEFLSQWEGSGGALGIAHLARTLGAEAVARARNDRRQTASASSAIAAATLSGLVDGDPGRVEAETVFEAARAGDPIAIDIIERICARAGRALATLALVLNPQLIVIGGAVVDAGDLLLDRIRSQIDGMTVVPTRVEASALRDRGPLIGAIRHALDDLEPRLLDGLDEAA
jgi:predicted NBD/HSP70 family sugar kinase